MESLELPHAKLFYCVYQLSESGRINDREKSQLKEMISLEHEGLLDIIRNHEDSPQLLDEIVKVVRENNRKRPEGIIPTKAYGDEISSPLGTFLLNKKKKQHEEHALHINLIDPSAEEVQEDKEFSISLFGNK